MAEAFLFLLDRFGMMIALPIAFTLVFTAHEFGHFIAARLCGVRVLSFSIGYGRVLWEHIDRCGTAWKVRLLPIGGFIKLYKRVYDDDQILAQDDDVKIDLKSIPEEQAFSAHSIFKRFIVVIAGPVANFILPVVLFFLMYLTMGLPGTPPYVSGVALDSAAYEAGFEPGDVITGFDGNPVFRFEEIWRVSQNISSKPLALEVHRGDNILNMQAVPRAISYVTEDGIHRSHGRLGIMARQMPLDLSAFHDVEDIQTMNKPDLTRKLLLEHMGAPFTVVLKTVTQTDYKYLVDPDPALNQGLNDQNSSAYDSVYLGKATANRYFKVGPVKAFHEALYATGRIIGGGLTIAHSAISGNLLHPDWDLLTPETSVPGEDLTFFVFTLIHITAVLSIWIGLINLAPVAWTDGGYLLLFLIESALGRAQAKKLKPYVSRLGVAILLGIMLFANLNDIMQLISSS